MDTAGIVAAILAGVGPAVQAAVDSSITIQNIAARIDVISPIISALPDQIDLITDGLGATATAVQVQSVLDQLGVLGSSIAGAATQGQVQAVNDLVSSLPTGVVAALLAVLRPDLQYYGGTFAGTDLEVQVGAVGAGSHLEVWGWIGTTGSKPMVAELRSGNTANDGASVSVKDLTYNLYAGGKGVAPLYLLPSNRALWRTGDGQGLIAYKAESTYIYEIAVWYRTVPN